MRKETIGTYLKGVGKELKMAWNSGAWCWHCIFGFRCPCCNGCLHRHCDCSPRQCHRCGHCADHCARTRCGGYAEVTGAEFSILQRHLDAARDEIQALHQGDDRYAGWITRYQTDLEERSRSELNVH